MRFWFPLRQIGLSVVFRVERIWMTQMKNLSEESFLECPITQDWNTFPDPVDHFQCPDLVSLFLTLYVVIVSECPLRCYHGICITLCVTLSDMRFSIVLFCLISDFVFITFVGFDLVCMSSLNLRFDFGWAW